ncbi:MAG TPA: hypothetical protein VER17_16515 [Tepidisphaeraceae bacterium]|nr:hypothetical protein [Tepidisphaeraceae bacterium]
MTFCTDIDLLHWEPNIARDAGFASQTLIAGTGNLAGAVFTLASGSLTAAHVTPGQVMVVTGANSASYPIVSVEGATQCTLSALYDDLFPPGGAGGGAGGAPPAAVPVGSGNGLSFVVRTFWPQRRVVSELLLQAAGLPPTADAADRIVNPSALKRPCALGTLHMIYSALAAAAPDAPALEVRVELYEKLYRRALRSARLELDLNGDGRADTARALNVLEMKRE